MHRDKSRTVVLLLLVFLCLIGTNLRADTTTAAQPDFHPVLNVQPAHGSIELHRYHLDDPVWRLERAQLFAKFQYLFRL